MSAAPGEYIDVVAAVIYNDDRSQVLLSLRKPDQHQGNLWEFPGGKQHVNESRPDALRRELHEELGIDVLQHEFLTCVEHCYHDKAVRLHFYTVDKWQGEPSGREQQQLGWFAIDALTTLPFPEANRVVVELLLG